MQSRLKLSSGAVKARYLRGHKVEAVKKNVIERVNEILFV